MFFDNTHSTVYLNLYCLVRSYAGLSNVLANGLPWPLVSVCLFGENLKVHTQLEKLRSSKDTTATALNFRRWI
jgi:hypothetical protein